MPFLKKRKPGLPTLGVFVPCDPRIDESSRQRAFSIGMAAARLLDDRLRLPGGASPNIAYASKLVDNEAGADAAAAELKEAGAEALFIVPDTWFFPGKTAMAVTSHFPPTTPLACLGGNNAPKPGVVGIDALVGAYAQTGRLCPMVIGTMPESGPAPDFDPKTKDEITDLASAVLAVVALRGKRFLACDTDSMQMETALNPVHAARRFLGLESARESMKIFADMLQKRGGYDPQELKALRDWTINVKFRNRIFNNTEAVIAKKQRIYTGGNVKPPALTPADRKMIDDGLALYLILRNAMRDLNAVAGGWTNQLAWGSDRRGLPLVTADIAESLFNSSEDHTGRKAVVPFATENDIMGLLTMMAFGYLSGGRPTLFMDFRKVYEPWEVEKNARELGLDLKPHKDASWLKRGFIDGNNSGSASLDFAETHYLFRAVRHYFPGGGFSVGFVSPKGIKGIAGRLGYSDLSGMFTMVQGEVESQGLPDLLVERVCHASDYSWPHTFLTFDAVPPGQVKVGIPANHLHMVAGMPRRRWQHFSDYTRILNFAWENPHAFVEGLDRPQPMLWRLNGGETMAKMRLAART